MLFLCCMARDRNVYQQSGIPVPRLGVLFPCIWPVSASEHNIFGRTVFSFHPTLGDTSKVMLFLLCDLVFWD